MSRLALPGLLLAASLVAPRALWAQALGDPTRPPESVLRKSAETAGPRSAAALAAETDSGPQLQLVLVGPDRRFAMIDGELVGVGGKVRDAKVRAVNADRVELRSDAGRETLKLYPDVDIRAAQARAAAPAKAQKKPSEPQARRAIVIKDKQ